LVKEEKKKVFNIFQHELVPKHTVLRKKDAEDILRRYHVRPYQFPYVKASDPGCQAIGAKPGDLVKIVRHSPTAGEAIAYRYVVED